MITRHQEAGQSTIDLSEDCPYVLQVLIRYLYKHVLDLSSCPDTIGASAFIIHVHKAACYYLVPQLGQLALQHLRKTCDPTKDEEDFIEALRVVKELGDDDTIWLLLLPKLVANKTKLLENDSFWQLITNEQPEINYKLTLLGTPALPDGVDEEKTCVAEVDVVPTDSQAEHAYHDGGFDRRPYEERRYRAYHYHEYNRPRYNCPRYRERRWRRRWYV